MKKWSQNEKQTQNLNFITLSSEEKKDNDLLFSKDFKAFKGRGDSVNNFYPSNNLRAK